MLLLRLIWLLAACHLAMALAWADYAWGHRRNHGPLGMNRGSLAVTRARPVPPPSETASGQSFDPASQEVRGAGDLSSLSLMKLANVSPSKTERAAALLRLAGQAETQGCLDLAMKVYTLTVSLYPDTPEADQARFQRLIRRFYLDLGGPESYQAFKDFLTKLSGLSARLPRERLREPLLAGWMALERTIRDGGSHPASWLEKALTLWVLHPPATRPPEAALLLGGLLKDHGFFAEADHLLNAALENGDGHLRSRAIIELLQLSWVSEGLPGFLAALKRWRQDSPLLMQALRTWPLHLDARDGFQANPPMDPLGNLTDLGREGSTPADSEALLTFAEAPLWETLLSQPVPASLREFVVRGLARHFWAQGDFPGAARLYRDLLAQQAEKETSPFYWDRLGLLHLKEQQPDLALDIFQALEREQTGFWQLVARTRQLDMELSRLMAEPAL